MEGARFALSSYCRDVTSLCYSSFLVGWRTLTFLSTFLCLRGKISLPVFIFLNIT